MLELHPLPYSEKSKSLGVDVARQINKQLGGSAYDRADPASGGNAMQEGEIVHFQNPCISTPNLQIGAAMEGLIKAQFNSALQW